MCAEHTRVPQTYLPYLEFYIAGIDILRGGGKRPRTLMGFSHSIIFDGSGSWRLDVFDPDYTVIEELLLSQNIEGLDTAANEYPNAGEGGDDEIGSKYKAIKEVYFRYGYITPKGEIIPADMDYYVGFVTKYAPTMQTNGVQLSIEGSTTGNSPYAYRNKPFNEQTFKGMEIYDAIKKLCELMEWEFRGMGPEETKEELPDDKRPMRSEDASQSMVSTEAEPRVLAMRDNESPYQFIQRISRFARPKGKQYNNFHSRLECKKATAEEPAQVYLHFGPDDLSQDPIRTYVYMRDKGSPVISFTVRLEPYPASAVGAHGMNSHVEDSKQGTFEVNVIDNLNCQLNYHSDERTPGKTSEAPEDGVTQEGFIQDEDKVDTPEGTVIGGRSLDPAKAYPPDFTTLQIIGDTDNRFMADQEAVSYWLSANYYVQRASLEVLGDPDRAIMPSKLVDVYVLVPDPQGNLKVHYTSQRWLLSGVVHQIGNGTYTTSMELTMKGFHYGGIAVNQQIESILEGITAAIGEEGLESITQ